MSILIKGMEMPKNCLKCPMANTYGGYGNLQGCFAIQGKEYAAIDERYDEEVKPSWCPLIEVPKHGRLIDANAAMKAACEALCHLGVFCPDNLCKEVRETFDAVPTIIESEEEDG